MLIPLLRHHRVVGGRRWGVRCNIFTLLELLVVVAIIAILAGILLPALKSARDRVRIAACQSNQKQLYTGVAVYAADYNGRIPETDEWNHYLADFMYNTGYSIREDETGTTPDNWKSVRRWWGLGKLAETGVVPPSLAYACPAQGQNVIYYDLLNKERWDMFLSLSPTKALGTSYVYNSSSYYTRADGGSGRGMLGAPGARGGTQSPDSGWYGPVRIKSLIQCRVCDMKIDSDLDTFLHQPQGFNCAYVDGHVKWLQISVAALGSWTSGSPYNYGNRATTHRFGLWPWATYMDK